MAIVRSRRMVAVAAAFAVGITAASITTLSSIGGATSTSSEPSRLVIREVTVNRQVSLQAVVLAQDGNPIGVPQTWPVSNCAVGGQPTDSPNNVEIVAMAGTTSLNLWLVSSRLGARQAQGGPCSNSNGLIRDGQSLTITVGKDLLDQGYAFGGATLDIRNFTSRLNVTIDETVSVSANVVNNQPLRVETPVDLDYFESIELSIAGGGTGNSFGLGVSGITSFDLVPMGLEIACGQILTADDFELDLEGTTIADVEFERLDDKGDREDCSRARLQLDVAQGVVRNAQARDELKIVPIGNDDLVRAIVSVTWNVERSAGEIPRSVSDINDELSRSVSYPVPTGGFGPFKPVEYCAAGTLREMGWDVSPLPASFNQPWCVLADERVLTDTQIVQTVTFYVSGDPLFR